MKQSLFMFILFLLSIAGLDSCKKEPSRASENIPPVAKAGKDSVILWPVNSIELDGSGSYDPDGSIIGYEWIKVAGPAFFTLSGQHQPKPIIKDLVQGIYTIQLKITDNKMESAIDTVIISVAGANNQPPVANAGPDQEIRFPASQVTLDGSLSSDPENMITSFQWRKISGTGSSNIYYPNVAQTLVNMLVEGIYLFELEVRDHGNLISKDTVRITVAPEHEITYESIWNLWHDPGDSTNTWDEIYTIVPVNSSVLSTLRKVYVSIDSLVSWEMAYHNSCNSPYKYIYSGSSGLWIAPCQFNYALVGQKVWVRISY